MDQLLTKKQLSQFLNVSPYTVDIWIVKRRIPYLKLGTSRNSSVRFDLAEIKNWLVKKGSNKQEKSPDNG